MPSPSGGNCAAWAADPRRGKAAERGSSRGRRPAAQEAPVPAHLDPAAGLPLRAQPQAARIPGQPRGGLSDGETRNLAVPECSRARGLPGSPGSSPAPQSRESSTLPRRESPWRNSSCFTSRVESPEAVGSAKRVGRGLDSS
ncbi:PREDICTED: translation initiation factor IF-2-like [Chinchilla lanigera]|uniref:translation initiation factor IF-2-like n=1 Tax=Chinchilla lanigera TaxID=34839 RepID=UPI00038EC699|nr:PREDICTED: translation initiation factor IF-2-like [Chinchilla lanigera]